MAVTLKSTGSLNQRYTPEELELLRTTYIDEFRMKVGDYDPEKNILLGKMLQYSDTEIIKLLNIAVNDINMGYPKTSWTLLNCAPYMDTDMVVNGAVIFAMMKEGIVQLRNQIDYSDSGLSIGMFNKTGLYQGWAGLLMQEYLRDKKDYKASVIPNQYPNAGFYGIESEYSYRRWM